VTDVLDAFALVALARDERAADDVEVTIRKGQAAITALNLAEALDVLGRVYGETAERLRSAFEPLLAESLREIAVDSLLAWRAAELRRRHYHRSRSPLSLADCVALAAASSGDSVVTADAALARAAGREGVEVVRLPRG